MLASSRGRDWVASLCARPPFVTTAHHRVDMNPASKQAMYRDATRAATLGLLANLALAVVKLAGGVVAPSFALISDGVNSLGDALTSVAVLWALWIAQRPPDAEHPYGHTRAEAIAGSNVAVLIGVSAVWVGWEAITRLSLQHGPPPTWTLWLAGANMVIKEALYQYKSRVGHRLNSTALLANAWDHRSDALCSLAVLVGLLVVRAGGHAYVAADEIAALVVVAAILWSAAVLLKRSVWELMDLQAAEPLLAEVRSAAASVEGVRAVETLLLRKTGLEYLADIHIEVDAHLSVAEGHRIGHVVKDELLAGFPTLRDVLVHLEPFPHEHAPARD